MKTIFGYKFMLRCNFQFHLCNQSTLQSKTYDDFLVARNYGKLSAKLLLGTSTVTEVELLSYFLFLARTIAKLRLNIHSRCDIFENFLTKKVIIGEKQSIFGRVLFRSLIGPCAAAGFHRIFMARNLDNESFSFFSLSHQA